MSQQFSVLTDYFESRAKVAPGEAAYYSRDAAGSWQATTWGEFSSQAQHLAAGLEAASLTATSVGGSSIT